VNLTKLGEVGGGQGVALQLYLDGSGNVHMADPRFRAGSQSMAIFNTEQRDQLVELLVASRNAERPTPIPGESVQADPDYASPAHRRAAEASAKPQGPVEPLHR
jgi:hypothetical protein